MCANDSLRNWGCEGVRKREESTHSHIDEWGSGRHGLACWYTQVASKEEKMQDNKGWCTESIIMKWRPRGHRRELVVYNYAQKFKPECNKNTGFSWRYYCDAEAFMHLFMYLQAFAKCSWTHTHSLCFQCSSVTTTYNPCPTLKTSSIMLLNNMQLVKYFY